MTTRPLRRSNTTPRTVILVYEFTHIRVRVQGDDVIWFLRDVTGALGLRHRTRLVAAAPSGRPGLATSAELEAALTVAGSLVPAPFHRWAREQRARLISR